MPVARAENNEERERRIEEEIVVDAYGEEERALGWYYYLESRLKFPFQARCVVEKRVSPLRKGEQVQVTGMAGEENCGSDMFVEVRWRGRRMGVPLAQLEGISVNEETSEALGDWRYWVARGYQF